MSYRFKLGLLSTVSLAALAAGGMSAWGAETVGNGSMTGTIAGDLVVASGGSARFTKPMSAAMCRFCRMRA